MEHKSYTEEEYQKANSAPILDVVERCGYTLLREDSKRFKLQELSGVRVEAAKNCWYQFGEQRGGGPVQLVQMLDGLSTVEAVQFINGGYYERTYQPPKREKQALKEKRPFVLPPRAPNHRALFAYLTKERCIDKGIVSHLLHEKRIYQTDFTDRAGRQHHNCVFVGFGENDKAVSASIRMTGKPTGSPQRIVSGSDTKHPFAMPGTGQRLAVYESAIDAMSGATLDRLAGRDEKQTHRIALNGLSSEPIDSYLAAHPEITGLVFCLDNDDPATRKDGRNPGQEKAVALCEAYREKGYRVERLLTPEKDINATLQVFVRERKETQEEEAWSMEM